MIHRRLLLALLPALLLLSAPALAKSGGAKLLISALPGMAVEYWDQDGLFHLVNIELLVEYDIEGVKVSNKVGDKIVKELSLMPWEEFTRENPAVVIKRVALDVCRDDGSAGTHVVDVLIKTLMLR